jgi:hypothetical protein
MFVPSLSGPQGEPGPQGPVGPAGPPGDAGNPGVQGKPVFLSKCVRVRTCAHCLHVYSFALLCVMMPDILVRLLALVLFLLIYP